MDAEDSNSGESRSSSSSAARDFPKNGNGFLGSYSGHSDVRSSNENKVKRTESAVKVKLTLAPESVDQIVVEGCGVHEANGTYLKYGTWSGFSSYWKTLQWEGKWVKFLCIHV